MTGDRVVESIWQIGDESWAIRISSSATTASRWEP